MPADAHATIGVMTALNDLIINLGLIGIVLVIFIESGFPFGFFLPGDSLLFTAGLLAAKGHFSIAVAVLAIFFANFAGVTIGYLTGKSLGKRWLKKEDSLLFRHEYIEKATAFYERHGGKAIILGRFIPAVRSFVPMVAGVAGMSYRRLMIFNAIGAILWASSVTLVGYYSGAWLEAHGINIELVTVPVILAIIIISFAAPMVHVLQDAKSRARLFKKFRKS